ncbi:hypothetical protein TRVA0_039S01134 [Trichomonascus vanleenenianus]|uniref:uncharacterized protein n=1 Tax=Trichomonascus vanleenenianus TaxID=2268995 RepID=UPI003EC9CCB2
MSEPPPASPVTTPNLYIAGIINFTNICGMKRKAVKKKAVSLKKKVDFLKRLPVEISDQVLDLLGPELLEARKVSNHWNYLCERLIWRKVVVRPLRFYNHPMLTFGDALREEEAEDEIQRHDGAIKSEYISLDDFDREELKGRTFMTLTYEQLIELRSDLKFQKALGNTIELHIYYAHKNDVSDEMAEEAFEVMPELFRRVNTIKVSYNAPFARKRFRAFQRMLNKWKSTAEFCLGLTVSEPYPDEVEDNDYIEIDDMKIRELYFRKRYSIGTANPLLPLSGTSDKVPIKWIDLPSRCPDLITLAIETDFNWFQSHWIPDTLKCIHLTNQHGEYSPSPVLKIPPGTESLYITDNYMLPVLDPPDSSEPEDEEEEENEMASILACVDLKNAAGLKTFNYKGPEFTNQLFQAILEVKKSLEHLTVVCDDATSVSLVKFRERIIGVFDLKQLQVYLGISRKEPWYDDDDCDSLFGLHHDAEFDMLMRGLNDDYYGDDLFGRDYAAEYDILTGNYLDNDYFDDYYE